MRYVKIFPEGYEELDGREVIYTLCVATQEDINKVYSSAKTRMKPVLAYKGDELIERYASISVAAKAIKIDSGNISKVLDRPHRTAGGYRWVSDK